MNRRFQSAGVRVPDTRQRRMNRTDGKLETAPLELQHLHIAKRLREDRIARVEVAEAHCGQCSGAGPCAQSGIRRRFGRWIGRSARDVLVVDLAKPRRSARSTYENRTSLPGSISKSSESESAVFGLITSSWNFT